MPRRLGIHPSHAARHFRHTPRRPAARAFRLSPGPLTEHPRPAFLPPGAVLDRHPQRRHPGGLPRGESHGTALGRIPGHQTQHRHLLPVPAGSPAPPQAGRKRFRPDHHHRQRRPELRHQVPGQHLPRSTRRLLRRERLSPIPASRPARRHRTGRKPALRRNHAHGPGPAPGRPKNSWSSARTSPSRT